MPVIKFKNSTGKPLTLCVEPWASEEDIPAGTEFEIHYDILHDRPDSSIELLADRLIFWCEGGTYDLEIDGRRVPT